MPCEIGSFEACFLQLSPIFTALFLRRVLGAWQRPERLPALVNSQLPDAEPTPNFQRTFATFWELGRAKGGWELGVDPNHPTNLYPSPCTVWMYCGCRGLSSSFWRSHATCTSTVRVEGIAL